MMTSRYMPMVDYTRIEATAPGRFILIGEFADLFEKNSIAMSIDRRTKVTIRPHKEGRLRLNLVNFNYIREWPTTSFTMTRLVSKYADTLVYSDNIPAKMNHLLHERYYQIKPVSSPSKGQDNLESCIDQTTKQADDGTMAFLMLYVALGDSFAKSARPPLDIEVSSDIPIGKGLGSSSAYAVALCAALMKVFRVSSEPYVISNWTLNIDRFFHGAASGLTTSTIIHGGYLYFQHNKIRAHGVEHISPIKAMMIDTGVQRNPKAVNEMISELVANDSHRVNNVLISISDLATQTWRKLNDASFAPKSIANHLVANQELLDSLGVGHSEIADICSKAHQFKLAVKQTHCGQCAFLLYDESDNCNRLMELKNVLSGAGYKYVSYDISYKGFEVKIFSSTDGETNEPNMKKANKMLVNYATRFPN